MIIIYSAIYFNYLISHLNKQNLLFVLSNSLAQASAVLLGNEFATASVQEISKSGNCRYQRPKIIDLLQSIGKGRSANPRLLFRQVLL